MSPCPITDKDQTFIVQDYGPGGLVAPVNLNLAHGLRPGGIVSAVITTDQDTAINLRDVKDNVLLHVVARVAQKNFALCSSLNGVWQAEQLVLPVPTKIGVRFVATIMYEAAGYRVFINGAEVGFYNHKSNEPVHCVEINGGMTFKLVYLSMRDIVPT